MSAGNPPYIEFGVQSNFSFLRAASSPGELVVAAKLLGYAGMGLADRNTVAGVVRAWSQSRAIVRCEGAEPEQIPFHPGCRLVFSDGTPDILAYPQDRAAWGRLCRMLTEANLREETEKGATLLERGDLLQWADGMSLAVLPDLTQPAERILVFLHEVGDRFGRNCRLAVAPLYLGDDRFRIEQAAALAAASGMSLMATNDVLYHEAGRRPLQDVVTAIRLNVPVSEAGMALTVNAERHLKTPQEMARLFRHHPEALAETIRFAETLHFSLEQLRYYYPDEVGTDDIPPQQELERLTWEGARSRYPAGIPEKIIGNIRCELELIGVKEYASYFLTVRDIMEFARSQGILCQGRGSAANSTVCFCLGITEVDPTLSDLLFERFISLERDEPPDIDVDFEHERREEVMQYVYKKYSNQRTALAAAVISYRGRSALREVSKAMGLSQDAQSALAGSVWGWSSDEMGETEAKAGGLDLSGPTARHVIDRANEIRGFPRHLTQHVGGFVITQDRLDEIVPIGKTAMETRLMVEWDKDDLDAVGMLKVDVLALGMLSCLRRCFDLLDDHYGVRDPYGRKLTVATIPSEEEDVYDMICRADTIGVFQIESRAQMSMLPRLEPREFYDLVIEVAIVRPGPIQGNMVHPYLRRRMGLEKVDYPSPVLESILQRTLGVPLFQEQAMKIAIEAAGFEASKADRLRRSMATFRRNGTIDGHRRDFIDGMVKNGYTHEFAERCFSQIEGFGDYGFPESHAASFALLVYASAWFKCYYPDVFCAAILNSQPMGFYAPSQLVRDAREHGVEVRPVDINHSEWDCTLEEAPFDPAGIAARHAEMRDVIRTRYAMRLGFRQIKGLSKAKMTGFVKNRGEGYNSARDIWLRSGLDIDEIAKLAEADAFRSLGLDRRAALWAVKGQAKVQTSQRLPLFESSDRSIEDNEPATALPEMPLGEHVVHDYRTAGLSLKAHPVSFLRSDLEGEGTIPTAALEHIANGRRVSVAGLVLVRQRPGSAKDVIFMTIEDEQGIANVIVWKKTFERFRPIVFGARFIRITGKLQKASGVIHVVAERLEDLTLRLGRLYTENEGIAPLSRADEVRHPLDDDPRGAHGEHRGRPASPDTGRRISQVMPKGRNFH